MSEEVEVLLCPECEQGKHGICTEEILTEVEGIAEWVVCECPCRKVRSQR